jgi:hypothetical protein
MIYTPTRKIQIVPPADPIGDVRDGGWVAPVVGEHSNAPLDYWREHLQHLRRNNPGLPRVKQEIETEIETPATPASLVDDFA